MLCRNITVEGCVFRDIQNLSQIVVHGASDVTVRNNDFGYRYDSEYDEYVAPYAAVNVEKSSNVEISGNTCPDGIDVKDWVSVKDSLDVHGDDMVG